MTRITSTHMARGAVVALICLAFLRLGQMASNNEYEQAIADWKVAADAELHTRAALQREADAVREKAYADSIRNDSIVRAQNTTIRKLAIQRARNDALLDSLRNVQPDNPVIAVAEAYRAEADTLRRANRTLAEVVESQKQSVASLTATVRKLEVESDSLARIIKTTPIHKPDSLLGIRLPSRTTAFIAGMFFGGALIVAVTR